MEIKIEDLSFSYDKFEIFNHLNLTIEAGSYVGIFGKNGIGKSTLLELMMGFSKVNSGTLRINGLDPATDPYSNRSNLFYLSDKVKFPEHWSLKDAIVFNSKFYPNYKDETKDELLELFGLDLDKPFAGMSAGQTKQAQIIVGLSTNPKLLIIDEMTAYLDIKARDKFNSYLGKINKELNTTIVLSTNIPEDLGVYPTHFLLLGGKAIQYIPASETSLEQVLKTVTQDPEVREQTSPGEESHE